MAVDEGLAIFRERNTDVSLVNGKSFGEVIDELVWTGDEMGLAASDGKLRAVGDKTIEKHEKRTHDSRLSVPFYRTGSVAGVNGPVAIPTPGVTRKPAFTDSFLEKHGAPPGSTIAMTATAYMTELAWEEVAPAFPMGSAKLWTSTALSGGPSRSWTATD